MVVHCSMSCLLKTLVFLFIGSFFTVWAQYSSKTCISDPQKILEYELSVNDTSVERYYFLCPRLNIKIKPYNWTSKTYTDGVGLYRPLSFIYPNAHILCGPLDGRNNHVDNNCTITGGTLQLEVVDASYYGGKSQKITNISVKGVTFSHIGSMPDSANVYIFGSSLGAELLVKECRFQDNMAIANIKFEDHYDSSVTVDGTIFKNNILVDSTTSRNAGLIFTDLGGQIFVNNSLFINNTVSTSYKDGWYGLNAIINANDIAARDEITSNINVMNSCFIQNKGITYSLVFGAMWGDAVLNSRNNYAYGNFYQQSKYQYCGIGQLYMNAYYDYFGYYNFSTGVCQSKFTAASCAPSPNDTVNTTAHWGSPSKTKRSVNVPAALMISLLLVSLGMALFLWRRKLKKRRNMTPVNV